MRRRVESLLPAAVLVAFVVAALVVNLLLTSAEQRGVDALEESLSAEVQAIAASQDQRFQNSFSSTQGLSNPDEPFELVEGSAGDLAQLERLLNLFGGAVRAGFYLLDANGTVTQGVLFTDDAIGTAFEWPGYDELVASPTFAQGRGGVLPVSDGLTTGEPVLAYVIPILDLSAGSVRGAFVLESVVAVDSDLNKEIGALQRGETGEYHFYDSAGTVIASNDPATIGTTLDDERMLTASAGLHHLDDHVVVIADVPSVGWRVGFRRDTGEFEEGLSRPLQRLGQVLILVLLAAGALLTLVLARRLRAARAEQERLAAISEAQQEFISIVSHELRTPVAGVLGFLETSLDHWDTMDDGERRSAVGRAASNARRLQALTRDVLDTQRLESGRLVHVLAPLDLAGEVRSAVEAAEDLDGERTFEVHLPDSPVWVSGDADRLQQVLVNLLDNACKNSPAIEPVEVRLEVAGREATVTVADHGAGITGDSLERIFDKFVRGRGESVTGTGLGLYISRQIIDAHDGRIWAESEPGQGARFSFVLPLGEPPEPSEPATAEPATAEP